MKCPHCGSDAYVGIVVIECSNPKCEHYHVDMDDDSTPVIDRTRCIRPTTTQDIDDAWDSAFHNWPYV